MVRRVIPKTGQESVWDYPRPPRIEACNRHLRILHNGVLIADTEHSYRVLETSHPPTYYLPQSTIQMHYLTLTTRQTFCEFKGVASYWTLDVEGYQAEHCAWMYASPSKGYEAIANHLAFYASLMDACFVDEEQVKSQAGDFYGGWITSNIVGPFKGEPGTWGW